MDICVVGGGAAGMMATIAAAGQDNNVTLVEQNDKLGKKLFLTGKGRCNMTNSCPVEELFDNIVTNPKFCYSALYEFDNTETIRFFNELGLRTKIERGQRVFPASDHSSDVIKVLRDRLTGLGVNIMTETKVIEYRIEDAPEGNRISGVIVKRGGQKSLLPCDAVIAATGGQSYPLTGSDGSAFDIFCTMGIAVKGREPSLVPFTSDDSTVKDMQGLSLKNVGLRVDCAGKTRYSGFGEMLFTHFGISGPLVLSASAFIREKDYGKGVTAHIDLKPALTYEELDRRILRDFDEFRNKDIANALVKLLPARMRAAVIAKSGILPSKKVNAVTKDERADLCRVIKDYDIIITGNRGFDEAIITRGGIDVAGINPSTMESKVIKGLFFAGEMIDVDALTGGFNLQLAWSTGYKAGKCCKEV